MNMTQREGKKKQKKNPLVFRINVLFFVVFLLFSILIVRLGFVQVVQGEMYKSLAANEQANYVLHAVPRGEIFDRNGNLIVYNIPEKAITYTPPKNPQPNEILEVAKKLAGMIRLEDEKKLPDWVKKEIWLLENDNGDEKITSEEEKMLEDGDLTDSDIYELKLERITEEEMAEVDDNLGRIYQKMRSAIALQPIIVKGEGVTDKEFATVSENLGQLPGVNTTMDWKRENKYDQTMQSVLGSVKEGLPPERLDYFLSKGYSLNDRYGSSYLEKQYEDILAGTKIREKVMTDKGGNILSSEIVSDGESGKDLVLTIDIRLQMEIEKIVQEELKKNISYPRTDTLDSAFVVAMNPKTGEILALVGKKYDRKSGDFLEYSHGTFTQAFEPGSVVKGATVLAGYQGGVLSPGERKLDTPINLPSTPKKSSWKNLGWVDDLRALEQSSNVYMWMIAVDLMDGKYVPGRSLKLDGDKLDTIRSYYSQFGLGVKTGIGFEEEVAGLKAKPTQPGNYIDIAIGQLDTYTPLQLAQYVSTIANGGYRMKPMIVKEIRKKDVNEDNEVSIITETFEPTVLNRIDMKEEWIERVQQGFWRVTHNGTARSYFAGESYNPAGKTGTAQSVKNGKNTMNSSFVGYAPYEDPEIAIAVIVPNAYYGSRPTPFTSSNQIAQRVFRAYFELKENGGSGNTEGEAETTDHAEEEMRDTEETEG